MEGNDIGIAYVARVAMKFEGLLMHEKEAEVDTSFLDRFRKRETTIRKESKMWRVNDMPMKSLHHMVNQMQLHVQVITYLGEWYEEEIEAWLSRKGVYVEVVSYDDPYEWAEDLRRNPEIQGYYTDDPQEKEIIGWQHVTVVRPTQTFGI